AFYRRTHPSLAGWRPIARLAPDVKPSRDGMANLVDWLCGCAMIYGVLFGVGKLLLSEWTVGFALLAVGLLAGAVIYWDLSRRGWSSVVD
ncbi:MAG: sodium:proline symporter, partial [Acidobacteriota bacterium]|nr:sodium:proline symporter [Acidobacteriota bacterium]